MSKVKFTEAELVDFIENIIETDTPNISNKPFLSESKRIRLENWADRFERKNKDKSPQIVGENFVKDMHRLHRAGFTLNEISYSLEHNKKSLIETVSVAGGVSQGVWGTFWDVAREGIWGMVLRMFGMKEDSEIYRALKIALAEVPFFELPQLLNCDYLTRVLTRGILGEYLPRMFAIKTGVVQAGTMEMIIGNSLGNLVDNSEIFQQVQESIKETVCGALGAKKSEVEGVLKKTEDNYEFGSKEDPEGSKTTTGKQTAGAAANPFGDIIKKYITKFKEG